MQSQTQQLDYTNNAEDSSQFALFFEQCQLKGLTVSLASQVCKFINAKLTLVHALLPKVLLNMHNNVKGRLSSHNHLISLVLLIYDKVISSIAAKNTTEERKTLAISIINDALKIHIKASESAESTPLQCGISVYLIFKLLHNFNIELIQKEILQDLYSMAIIIMSQEKKHSIHTIYIAQMLLNTANHEDNDDLLEQIKYCLTSSLPCIRKAAVKALPLHNSTAKEVIYRTTDTSIDVRMQVYDAIIASNYFTKLAPQQRVRLAYNGINDCNAKVRQSIAKILKEVLMKTEYSCSTNNSEEPLVNPSKLLSYFNVRNVLADSLYSTLVKQLVEFMLDLISQDKLFQIIKITMKHCIEYANGNTKLQLYEEEMCFLHFCVEIWKSNMNNKCIEYVEEVIFSFEIYQQLFSIYENQKDFLLIYFHIPLIGYVYLSSTKSKCAAIQLLEAHLMSSSAYFNDRVPIDINYVICMFTKKSAVKFSVDCLSSIASEILHLKQSMNVPNDEIFDWLIEKISDITEPLVIPNNDKSCEDNTLIQKLANEIHYYQLDINEINKIQVIIDRKDSIIVSDKLCQMQEKQRSADRHHKEINKTKAQIGNILKRALIFFTNFVYCIYHNSVSVETKKLNEAISKLLELSQDISKSSSLLSYDSDMIKIYEMILSCSIVSCEKEIFIGFLIVLANGLEHCTCSPTPSSIASAMSVMDNILARISDEYNEPHATTIKNIKNELVKIVYSDDANIKYIGVINIIKLFIFDPKANKFELLCRIYEIIGCIYNESNYARAFNIADAFIKESSSTSLKHYRMLINSLVCFTTLHFAALNCKSIGSSQTLCKVKRMSIIPIVEYVIAKLTQSLIIWKEKSVEIKFPPLYKYIMALSIIAQKHPKNKIIAHHINSLLGNKVLKHKIDAQAKEQIAFVLKHTLDYNGYKNIEKFVELPALSSLLKKNAHASEKAYEEYIAKKGKKVCSIIVTMNEVGNVLNNEDISLINMKYTDAINHSSKHESKASKNVGSCISFENYLNKVVKSMHSKMKATKRKG